MFTTLVRLATDHEVHLQPMNKQPFLPEMRKKNNGQCRQKNKKLCKVKGAGESDHTPFNERTGYYKQ